MSKKTPSDLRHLPPPALTDYSGPPDGDYVRYVERLMAWAEQEHARTGGFALSNVTNTTAAPKAAASKAADIVRQVSAMLEKNGPAQPGAGKKRPAVKTAAPRQKAAAAKALQPSKVASFLFGLAFLAAFIFKPEFIPLAIGLWVVLGVRRALQAAKAK